MKKVHLGELIVFEGVDKVGKTTLAQLFVDEMQAQNVACKYFSFPGREAGTLGEQIYRIHHQPDNSSIESIDPTSLQLLHIAAHIDAIRGKIVPELESGTCVVLDRFWWSTWVYGLVTGADKFSLGKMIELELYHWGAIKPSAIFLVERSTSPENLETAPIRNSLVREYQALAHNEAERQNGLSKIISLDNSGELKLTLAKALSVVQSDFLSPSGKTEPPPRTKLESQKELLFSSNTVPTASRSSAIHNLYFPSPAPKSTLVYETYWRFAVERQATFFRRFESTVGTRTNDPILLKYKFTNAYRASDRVSQYLIKEVIYRHSQQSQEIFFRILLFKLFNRIETWKLLESSLGALTWESYDFDRYDTVLTKALHEGARIYSAAYIMPSGGRASSIQHGGRKHRLHLRLLEKMMRDEMPSRIAGSKDMHEAFHLLRDYATIGDFLAYQYVTDLNYSTLTDFSEMEFVVPGPGAKSGLYKCFADFRGHSESDLIRMVTENQIKHREQLGITNFRSLWGRELQLIDCQNLFCEVDKYSRIYHPETKGLTARIRIKQHYRPYREAKAMAPWYPPKWNLNKLIADTNQPPDVQNL